MPDTEASTDVPRNPSLRPDFTRATLVTPEVALVIDEWFDYQPWDGVQQTAGIAVRRALVAAVKVIIEAVPPCPDRSAAIRKIREARMDANSAITHRGKY